MASLDIGSLPDSGWTAEDLGEIFAVTRWWLGEHQMFVMVGVAVALAFTILIMIVNLFDRSKEEEDDEDPYEYREY